MRSNIWLISALVFLSCKDLNQNLNDNNKDQKKENSTSPILNFSNFEVNVFNGKVRPVDSSNSLVKKHWLSFLPPSKSTELAFAGHFGVIRWQHSANSTGGLIVDLKSGEVYELPKTTLGYSYKINSRLLITNPKGNDNICYSCKTEYWVWEDSPKLFKKL